MNVNTSKEKSLYTQGQQFVARVLFTAWLLASGSPEGALATPKRQPAMVPATTTSPGDPSLASVLPTPTPGDQLPPDSSQEQLQNPEYAGRALARQFLSQDEDDQKRVSNFLSENKYNPQCGQVLSFMAGEVSSIAGVEGIKQLLTVLGEEQEIVGLQHLLLQLRVVHEWLCMATEREVEKGMSTLEDKFQVKASLNQWFGRAFAHVRLDSCRRNSTGRKLLELLTSSLQTFGTVASHAPGLFQLLKDAAQDKSDYVRQATLGALSSLVQAAPALAPEAFSIIQAVLKDKSDYVRQAALGALSSLVQAAPALAPKAFSIIQAALKDETDYVRQAALELLSSLIQLAPAWSPEALPIIQAGLKDKSKHVHQATFGALSSLVQAAPEQAQEVLAITQAALKDETNYVRQAALRALSTLTQAAPERVPEAFSFLGETLKDRDSDVRQAALRALLTLTQVAPKRDPEALAIIRAAAKGKNEVGEDDEDEEDDVRQAAQEALSTLIQVAPEQAQEALAIIRADAKKDWRVRQAAFGSLSTLVQAAPERAPEALEIIRAADKEEHWRVLQAAFGSLSTLVQIAPERAPEALEIIRAAAKDRDWRVRQTALGPLSTLVQVAPERAPEALTIIRTAAKTKALEVRQAAQEALSTLVQVAPSLAPEVLAIIQAAATKDKYMNDSGNYPVRTAALGALTTLVQAAPTLAPEALAIIRTAAKDERWVIREAALGSLSALIQAAPALAPETLEIIRVAAKDEYWLVRHASLSPLSTLVQADPALAPETLEIIRAALKDEDYDLRSAALRFLSTLAQTSPALAQEALEIIREVLTATDGSVHQAALGALLRATLEQLLESYWSRPDASLIPYIAPRLYHTPLVVGKSPREGYQPVILYAPAGKPQTWKKPQEDIQRFVRLIEAEASQLEQRPAAYAPYEGLPKKAVIDKSVWERYFGPIGAEPALPADIVQIMHSPCPFFSTFWKRKRVKDTHLLVLIPERVAGKTLTLDYLLDELIESPRSGGHGTTMGSYPTSISQAIGSQGSGSSYWVLMTRDVLPGSRYKSYEDQCKLVADHVARTGLDYRLPGALEASVVILLHHVRSGKRLYRDNGNSPSTYTYCRDKIGTDPMAVGNFSSEGFNFCNSSYSAGVAGLRKF